MPHPRHRRRFGGPRAVRYIDASPIVVESLNFDVEPEPDEFLTRRIELDQAGALPDFLPTFVTAETAKQYINETDAAYDRLNTAIVASTSAPPEFKTSWAIQIAAWKTFATGARASVGFLDAKAVMQQTDRWSQQVADWRTEFVKIGGVPPGPAPTAPGQGVPGSGPSLLGESTGLIVAAGVVAAIVIFGPRFAKG